MAREHDRPTPRATGPLDPTRGGFGATPGDPFSATAAGTGGAGGAGAGKSRGNGKAGKAAAAPGGPTPAIPLDVLPAGRQGFLLGYTLLLATAAVVIVVAAWRVQWDLGDVGVRWLILAWPATLVGMVLLRRHRLRLRDDRLVYGTVGGQREVRYAEVTRIAVAMVDDEVAIHVHGWSLAEPIIVPVAIFDRTEIAGAIRALAGRCTKAAVDLPALHLDVA